MRFATVLLAAALFAQIPGCGDDAERPNVVVIVLDTMRRDVAGAVDETTPAALRAEGLTPNLDELSAEGVVFTRAFAAAPWTVPSHASMFTGRLPGDHRCVSRRPRLNDALPTFATHLAAAGYETAAFFSNPWLSERATNLLHGFAEQTEAAIGGPNELTSSDGDQGGARSVASAARWLDERDPEAPFLMFVNLLETHLAYDPPADYRIERLADLPADDVVPIAWGHEVNAGARPHDAVDWPRVRRLYAGDAWAADRYLGRLLDALAERGLDDDTVVIVTSDHGENLGEHGLVEHQFSVHETLLAVPLVLRVPVGVRGRFAAGAAPGAVRDDPAMLTDLYATVLELAGVDDLETPGMSRSWLHEPAAADRPLHAEYAGPPPGLLDLLRSLNPGADLSRLEGARFTVRVGDLRLTAAERGVYWLHDMAADPGQRRNLAADNADLVRGLIPLLTPPSGPAPENEEPATMDDETRRRLESLGYIH